jgi:hypothetical protein
VSVLSQAAGGNSVTGLLDDYPEMSLDLRGGDALIDLVRACFGAPLSQEDQALRTCCAVFSVHEPVALAHSPVGLASGLMLLSTSGEGAGIYPAFGATIHLASGLQALARRATTLCARSTRSLAGPLPISSRSDRARLVGIRQRVFRSDGSVARGLSPCVGRSIELAELSTFAQTVPTGASVAVVIVGDAGGRKSRLAWELRGSLRPDTGQVIQAEAVSYGRYLIDSSAGWDRRAIGGFEERVQ